MGPALSSGHLLSRLRLHARVLCACSSRASAGDVWRLPHCRASLRPEDERRPSHSQGECADEQLRFLSSTLGSRIVLQRTAEGTPLEPRHPCGGGDPKDVKSN
ncbi:MAG: hypothetical protein SGPRY_007875, partial [Prymnesium sp.]